MRRRGSVLTQLLLTFSVFAVVIGAAMVVNYVAVAHQNAVAEQVTGRYTVLQQEETALETAYGTADFAVVFHVITGQNGYLLPVSTARMSFYRNLDGLRRHATPGLRGLIEVQASAGTRWFSLAPRLATAVPRTPATQALYAQSNQYSTQFLTALTASLNRLHTDIEQLATSTRDALRTGLVWSGVAVVVALLLVLVASLSTVQTVTRPLRALAGTVGELTRGDHAARARVTGSAEVQQVARSVNRQADEADRLRAAEAESSRLHAAAREAGLRIREPMVARDVLREARTALARTVPAQRVAVALIQDGQLVTPDGIAPEPWWPPYEIRLTGRALARLRQLLRTQRSLVIQDVPGPDGERIPAGFREWLRGEGVDCLIATPFGVASELAGVVILLRLAAARWSTAEMDAAESIAADIGRGLNHARLYEAEGKLVEDLKSLDRAKSDFFATVSHELRSPLTSIEGYVEMLGDDPGRRLDAGQRHMVQAIDRGAARLRGLIDDVFTLAKLESGAFETVTRPVDMADVISAAVETVTPSAAEKQLSLTAAGVPAGLVVDGDAGQLERVVINLLSNAVKFTPAGGQVTVTAVAAGESAVIAVSDTGIGIPEADQHELFSRFFRASNAVDKAIPGTGLGLAIVATIVANHGGTVAVESREGAGTTFTISLPLQPSAAA